MKKLLISSLVVALPLASFGDLLWNQPVVDPPNGFFSDGVSTNGSQIWMQTIADDFSLASDSHITQITFDGSSENLN